MSLCGFRMNGQRLLGSVREEARQAGVYSPTVFVFLPRLEADELRQTIGRLGAAEETVNTRAVPQTSAGIEARGAMQSRIALERKRLSELVDNIIKNARVYQGGGNEIIDESFPGARQTGCQSCPDAAVSEVP